MIASLQRVTKPWNECTPCWPFDLASWLGRSQKRGNGVGWYWRPNDQCRWCVTCEPIRALLDGGVLCSLKSNMWKSDLPFPADKYLLIHPRMTARLWGCFSHHRAGRSRSTDPPTPSNCESELTMLLTEPEIVWDWRLGACIWPGDLHAACCRNVMMEPEQNLLKQSFVESGVFLPGCKSNMTCLCCLNVSK